MEGQILLNNEFAVSRFKAFAIGYSGWLAKLIASLFLSIFL